RLLKRLLDLLVSFVGCSVLLLIDIKDVGAVLLSGVRALAVDFGWIVCAPEKIEKFVVACFAGIERDLYRLGTLHIARDHRGYPWRLLKNCLGAPKTTAREIGGVCRGTVRLRTKCHHQGEYQIVRQRLEEKP